MDVTLANRLNYTLELTMNRHLIVVCTECSEEHDTETVKFLNIEEDVQGRDIMYFECPVTNLEAKSMVYAK